MTVVVPHVLPPAGHHCAECGFRYDDLSIDDAAARIREALRIVHDCVTATTPDRRRARRDDVWSINEYVCHLRDLFITSTIRLHRATTEDRPFFDPMFNDLRAKRFAYRDLDAAMIMPEVALVSDGFIEKVQRTHPDVWERNARRIAGEERTARWFVQHAVHEAVHHARDIAFRHQSVMADPVASSIPPPA